MARFALVNWHPQWEILDPPLALMAISYDTSWISVIWDFQENRPHMPDFQRQALLKGKDVSEKNWVPLIKDNTLYIIKNLDPLHVLKCSTVENCRFNKSDTDTIQLDEQFPLIGGTGFEEYQYPYYIGVAHSTIFKNSKRYYRAHLVLLYVEPDFGIVYISDALQLHPHIYAMFNGPKH